MFTGLVEEIGTVLNLTPGRDVTVLEIRAPGISPPSRGDSPWP